MTVTQMCDDLERAIYGDVQVRRGESVKVRWARLLRIAEQKLRRTGG